MIGICHVWFILRLVCEYYVRSVVRRGHSTNTHARILSVCACVGVYISRATKFRTLAPIIFSIIIAVFPSHIQNVYHFTCKVKVTCYMQSMHRVELQVCRISTPALGAGGWSATHPSRFTPGDRVGLGGRYGWVRKISCPPGFDSRTVQPVRNRCSD